MRRLMFAGAILALVGCAPSGGDGTVGVQVSALTGGCGDQAVDPITAIDSLRVIVTGPDRETGVTTTLLDETHDLSVGNNTLEVSGVPSGSGSTLTLLGFSATDTATPSWFGRHRELSIVQDEVNTVQMVMTRLGQSSCITPPTSFTHRAFPAVVTLSDGRVLITGGFTRATIDPGDGTRMVLEAPSDVSLIYDPTTGVIVQTNTMTRARAGHTMVAVSTNAGEKVLVFGGTTRMFLRTGNTFPFELDPGNSLDSYEVFDVATQTFAGTSSTGAPFQMHLKRAFPMAQRMFDHSILIAGGGPWPSTEASYRKADLWAPYVNDNEGGLLTLTANRPEMVSVHNGGAMVKLEDTSEGLTRVLVVGGTTDATSVVELFTQSSGQAAGASGSFRAYPFPGLPSLFFPSVTPLSSGRFLVLGGVAHTGGGFQAPAQQAYLLTVAPGDVVTVDPIETSATGCSGRFFHQAAPSFDGTQAIITGGFSDFTGTASAGPCTFDLAASTRFVALPALDPRAGHAAVRLLDDSVLMVGGMDVAATLDGAGMGAIEVLTPSTTPLELAVEVQ